MTDSINSNLLYFGDNLEWLKNTDRFPDDSVDLIYLDPPFNSKRDYNVLFKESDVRESEAQIRAFEDTWAWDSKGKVQSVFDNFWLSAPERPKQMLKNLIDALGHNDVTAYLTMMAPRLVELHRILRPTGSLYLHCDPTASHYLKVLLDSIFHARNFRNEIVWRRSGSHNSAKRFGPIHDIILFYSKTSAFKFNRIFRPYSKGHVEDYFKKSDENGRYWTNALTGSGVRNKESGQPWRGYSPTAKGRHWAVPSDVVDMLGVDPTLGVHEKLDALLEANTIILPGPDSDAMPTYLQYLHRGKGLPVQDIWAYQPHTSGVLHDTDEEIDRDVKWLNNQGDKERLGYPTQKPLGLLKRIIMSSSDPGDVILDPFCGCGTAVHAAHSLQRRWIGIDITPLATDLIRDRLQRAYPGLVVRIEGWPSDMDGARALAAMSDRYFFQDWAVIEIGARPAGGKKKTKKGADQGVDGVIPFLDGPATPRRGVVSVKSGATGPKDIRDLGGVVAADDGTEFGVFVCLETPTKPMVDAALNQGTWVSGLDKKTYPKIQILTAQDILDGIQVNMPAGRTSLYARPSREGVVGVSQPELGISG